VWEVHKPLRATYYVVDRADAPAVLKICGEFFREIRPAATLLLVAGLLAPEMRVEIEVTALRRA
jgi:enamine deaminase RidA (YjgF/YER057c/UK114 family)